MHYSGHQPIEGMTVNERLWHFGLTDEYDSAIRSKNKELAIAVLQRAKFTREQAEFTTTTTLADPQRYGY